MTTFFQQVVSGLASGGIYGALALALVLIHRATGILNFAQGEMGMFATYIAWSLINTAGMTYWLAFGVSNRRRLFVSLSVNSSGASGSTYSQRSPSS